MPTMKDVARLAGVSHGTVSNVLNGSKGVSIDKIRRVEEAVKALGYKPNALARNLKTSSSGRIDVLLPNVTDRANAALYESIAAAAARRGCGVYLQLCGDSAEREKENLDRAHMYNTDGVILMTCRPERPEVFAQLAGNGLNLVFVQREVASDDFAFAGLDARAVLAADMRARLERGTERIAIVTGPRDYSFEAACIDGYCAALFKAGVDVRARNVEAVDFSREAAMRAAIRLLESEEPPTLIYCTSETLYEGVCCALRLAGRSARLPRVLRFDAEDWTSQDDPDRLPLPYAALGEAAFGLLAEGLDTGRRSTRRIIVRAKSAPAGGGSPAVQAGKKRALRVLLQDAPSSDSVRKLLPDFERRTGIAVEVETQPYREVLGRIKGAGDRFDVFTFDLAWMKELALSGYIRELTGLYPDEEGLSESFSGDVLREHCYFRDRLHALPYSHTAQLLFYRKDLFEELKNQRLYFEAYKEELRVPHDWQSYNRVARFFTRSENPESPTLYGTTLGARNPSGAVCEFLPRAWAFGGELFKDGACALGSESCIEALACYQECFRYAHPDSPDMWWDEQAAQFARGDAAMMIMFTDHTTRLFDRTLSRVAGTTGCALLPGKASVLGGWSVAIGRETARTEEALAFIQWVTSERMVIPNAALGRVEPRVSVYGNSALSAFCPYVEKLPEAFSYARRRSLPKDARGAGVPESRLEEILGGAVHGVIKGRSTPAEALQAAARELDAALR